MTRLPNKTFKHLKKTVESLGFQQIRQKGSHTRYEHPDGRGTTIPDHGAKDVPKGLLFKIDRHDLEMENSEFEKSL